MARLSFRSEAGRLRSWLDSMEHGWLVCCHCDLPTEKLKCEKMALNRPLHQLAVSPLEFMQRPAALVPRPGLDQTLTEFKRSINVIGCCGDSWKP